MTPRLLDLIHGKPLSDVSDRTVLRPATNLIV